jgi:hypothetical protein
MKIRLILIFLLAIVQTSWAQDCDFVIRNFSNILNGKSELIDKSEYDKVVLSIYSALNKKYEQNKVRLEETLDLFDILLKNNRMRGFATDAINSL